MAPCYYPSCLPLTIQDAIDNEMNYFTEHCCEGESNCAYQDDCTKFDYDSDYDDDDDEEYRMNKRKRRSRKYGVEDQIGGGVMSVDRALSRLQFANSARR